MRALVLLLGALLFAGCEVCGQELYSCSAVCVEADGSESLYVAEPYCQPSNAAAEDAFFGYLTERYLRSECLVVCEPGHPAEFLP